VRRASIEALVCAHERLQDQDKLLTTFAPLSRTQESLVKVRASRARRVLTAQYYLAKRT